MKIIKAPFSGGGLGHGNGANIAPNEIIKQLKELFLTEDGNNFSFEYDDLVLDEQNISESHKKIEESVEKTNEKAIILGGDHSITAPCVKGFAKNNDNFKFIVLDAHPDLMDDFDPPTQEDYLKVLIEKGIIKPENILLIGLRNMDKQELDYLKEKNIKYYSAKYLFEKGIKELIFKIIDWADKPLYLSIDIDVVDPVEAIGTGYLEHGGLSSRELIFLLQELKKTNKIKMCDLVEVNPSKDVNNITSTLAAKILVELSDF